MAHAPSAAVSEGQPAISSHRLLGDGRSCALLRPDGEIDWWCTPAMDSAPVLWSLLDGAGAAARWLGVRSVSHDQRPAGPTSCTTLRCGQRLVRTWDGVVGVGDGSLLVRLVRGEDGDLDIVHELSLGGFDQPWGHWEDRRGQLCSGAVVVRVIGTDGDPLTPGSAPGPGPALLLIRLRARRGRRVALTVGHDGDRELSVEELLERLRHADDRFQGSLDAARLPRHHPERVTDALAVLEVCTYAPTGAVIASPTTSLPEAPGHDRQFDYRYSWLRDASLAVSVAALLGRHRAVEAYLGFIKGITSDTRVPSGPMTDIRGGDVTEERQVVGVAGWARSQPVRVGNAAVGQVQYDALGMLVEAVSVHLQTGGALDGDTWDLVQGIADRLAGEDDRHGVPFSNGMWELRQAGPLVSGDLGRWLALDRAIWIARLRHPLRRRRSWKHARARARQRVVAALGEDGGLPQRYDGPSSSADASALMAAMFGVVKGEQASRLVDATIAKLEVWPHLYRYEPGSDDGFSGREASFVPMSWWAVAALAAVRRVDEARERADALCAVLPRLQAEEFDADNARSLGNVPLVWSQMAAARAMYILDAADLRSRYGTLGLSAWRVGRYVRLRAAR
ncbi:MAG: glycoside hydrolase family 15 protein [Actinomycetota bacterium]|nr:glycoside hydrolase family 15 protein [Actinomycetota bacterium]